MTVRIRPSGVDRFRNEVEDFVLALEARNERTRDLLGPREDLDQSPEVLQRALDELRFRHEELLVAEEELRTQLDALAQVGLHAEAERQQYVDLFEAAPDAYLVTDLGGLVRDANTAAVSLFAIELRFLRGKPTTGLVSLAGEGSLHEALAALVRSGEPATTLSCLVKPRGGRSIPCSARIAVASHGTRLLWAVRRVDPELDRSLDLARALRDKEELLERERQAREELQRANEAKDRFIAVLSHDLRSPLNAILGWVQMLRREVLDSTARNRAFETIERNALAQARLIDELLDISRMAADQFHLELGPVDLAVLAGALVEGSLPAAQKAGVTLRFEGPSDPARIMGDARRIEQIATNLVANALKFTHSGGEVVVAVTTNDGVAELSVRDTGRGIRASLLPKLFDLYTQERSDVASRHGLGLGLWIAKRLAELHLGTIRAESAGEGQGATFTISFPMRNELTPEPAEEAPVSTTELRGLRVLVVDDEDDARDLSMAILRRARADVRAASGAAAALDELRNGDFDVVVSDLEMPGTDGFAFVRAVRGAHPRLGVIAVSGYATRDDSDRALAAGFDGHLPKPCRAEDLVEAVRRVALLRGR